MEGVIRVHVLEEGAGVWRSGSQVEIPVGTGVRRSAPDVAGTSAAAGLFRLGESVLSPACELIITMQIKLRRMIQYPSTGAITRRRLKGEEQMLLLESTGGSETKHAIVQSSHLLSSVSSSVPRNSSWLLFM